VWDEDRKWGRGLGVGGEGRTGHGGW
jgi:hypothetical protein